MQPRFPRSTHSRPWHLHFHLPSWSCSGVWLHCCSFFRSLAPARDLLPFLLFQLVPTGRGCSYTSRMQTMRPNAGFTACVPRRASKLHSVPSIASFLLVRPRFACALLECACRWGCVYVCGTDLVYCLQRRACLRTTTGATVTSFAAIASPFGLTACFCLWSGFTGTARARSEWWKRGGGRNRQSQSDTHTRVRDAATANERTPFAR